LSRIRKKPDSIGGKRLAEGKRVKIYGGIVNALFLHKDMEGK
jgi:hypothetical protein